MIIILYVTFVRQLLQPLCGSLFMDVDEYRWNAIYCSMEVVIHQSSLMLFLLPRPFHLRWTDPTASGPTSSIFSEVGTAETMNHFNLLNHSRKKIFLDSLNPCT